MTDQTSSDSAWENRVDALWQRFDLLAEADFVRALDDLVAELPDGDPRGWFERASARDSLGHSDEAVPLYRQALAGGLAGSRRRRATIQLASSLRNVGDVAESVRLLTEERQRGSDELDGAVAAFLALALVDAGREREAASVAIGALAPHLPRYQRAATNYARLLVEPDGDG